MSNDQLLEALVLEAAKFGRSSGPVISSTQEMHRGRCVELRDSLKKRLATLTAALEGMLAPAFGRAVGDARMAAERAVAEAKGGAS